MHDSERTQRLSRQQLAPEDYDKKKRKKELGKRYVHGESSLSYTMTLREVLAITFHTKP